MNTALTHAMGRGGFEAALNGPVPAVATVEGGSTWVALAAILTFFVALIIAVLLTYRVIEGYYRTRKRPFLFLAIGIFLLAPFPLVLRLLLANVTAVPLTTRSVLASGSELLGLLFILYMVYEP